MAGLLDLFGERSPEDPVNYGLLSMAGALGTPVRQGGGVGPAFAAYGHGLQTQQQLLERRALMQAQMDHLRQQTEQNGQDPAALKIYNAFKGLTPEQQKMWLIANHGKIFTEGGVNYLGTADGGLPMNAPGTAATNVAGITNAREGVKAAYDVLPVVDAGGNDTYTTRANILGARPVTAPQLSFGGGSQPPFMQPQTKPNLDATGLDAANGYPSKVALNTAIQNVQDPMAQFRPPAAGNAARAQKVQEADVVGKFQGDMYQGFVKSGIEAQQTINKLDRFQQLLEGVDTGKLTPMGTEIAGYLKSLNIDIDPNLDNKQAANSLSKEMALMLRKPGKESGGMPGNFSDQDRNFLTAIAPSLANTPGGNKLIIDLSRKMAQRDAEMADLAETYRSQNGSMDGFAKVQRAYAAAHPLFGEDDKARVSAVKSSGGSIKAGTRSKTKDGRDVEFDGTGWKLVQ